MRVHLGVRPAQVMISQLMSSTPALGSVLTAWSLEPASDSVSPSLSAPSRFMLCLSLSKINKQGRLGGSVSWAADFGSGHDLTVREFEPRVGLWADGSEPGACFGFCISFSLCPSPAHALSYSVSQK